ncbi:MAG: class A beta-lactamase-related serine hydrolase [Desulfotignum sp.]|nr:class A beta-lactamase-related serine hydrolase [Desulfotignum sp.]
MKQIFIILMLLSFAYVLEGNETVSPPLPLPLGVNPASVRPLVDLVDNHMQDQLLQRLNQTPLWKKLIREKKMTVGLVDLANPSEIRYAGVNGNEMIYAASLPKIAILLTAFHCFENRTLEQTPEVTRDLHLMIRASDNQAATRMIERLGMEQIQQVLTLNRYDFYDAARGGGLWVGKEYARTGRRLPEPIKGLSHAANASQVCRFYYQLAMGKLINRERSREMLEIMVNPGIEHKFVKTLKKTMPQALVFRKSGTWKTWHSDSVLVWGPEWRRYIAVALIDNPNGETILRKLIPELEAVLSETAAHRHAARRS